MAKITVRNVPRRTPEEITALARDVITNCKMVTDEPEAVRCAFLLVSLMTFTPAATRAIGALIGDYGDTMGRSLNGYPMFHSVAFLHRKDVKFFNAELRRLREALGMDEA